MASDAPDVPNPPQAWLYVSRRLDLLLIPNEPPWDVPAFSYGGQRDPSPAEVREIAAWMLNPIEGAERPTVSTCEVRPQAFYRLTPAVLAWLERAGESLEAAVLAGRVDAGQLDEYLAAMDEVWRFANLWLAGDDVRAARRAAGGAGGVLVELPECEGPK